MANYRNDFADVNLETGTICRNFMNHSIGSGDALGDRFGVRVFRNGEPVSLGGTVAGYFVRNTTGETVVISSGVVSGNEAYVTLPAACYAVEGSFTLAIKVTSGSETVTMRIIDGVVSRTNTSVTVDPGTLVPSIETLISAINSAVGQIPVNYNASFAPAYSASSTYAVGDYVVYDGYLWRCTTAITETESWTAAHWTKVALASDVSDLKSAMNTAEETIKLSEYSPIDFGTIYSKGINANDGTVYNSTVVSHTDYIDLSGYSKIKYKGMGFPDSSVRAGIAFYNSSKVFLIGIVGATSQSEQGYLAELSVATLPPGTKYARFSVFANTSTYGTFELYGESILHKTIERIQTDVSEVCDDILTENKIAWEEYGNDSYPVGWARGYYNVNTGDAVDSGLYMRSVKFIQFDNQKRIIADAPDGYAIRAYEFKNDGTIGYIGDMNTNNTTQSQHLDFWTTEGSKYKFSLGRFATSDPSNNYLTEEFVSTIHVSVFTDDMRKEIKRMEETVEDISNLLYVKTTYNWEDIGSQTYPLGWRTGYYNVDSGNRSGSNLYICSISYLSFNGANYVEMTAPKNYFIRANVYNAAGIYQEQYITAQDGKTVTIENPGDNQYKFTIGRFGNKDAEDYITTEFLSQAVVTAAFEKYAKGKYKDRTSTYEFFTVDVDRPLTFNEENYTTDTETIECVLMLPSTYSTSGMPTRLALYAHGAHGYVDSANDTWFTSATVARNALVNAGYALFDANVLEEGIIGGDNNEIGYCVGSPLYINILKKAYDYIVDNYNVYPQIFCHGISMGGVGATAFSHLYPNLVLAESSFAGRDILRYIYSIWDAVSQGNNPSDRFAKAYGYADGAELVADKFSHVDGISPSLSLKKLNDDGTITIAPDRETDFSGWLEFWGTLANHNRNDNVGKWIGVKKVPYKAWNSWGDSEYYTELEVIFQQAYTAGGSTPYYIVNYETGTHSEICQGAKPSETRPNMIDQLIAWYKRWE